jgi:hypothetical protein
LFSTQLPDLTSQFVETSGQCRQILAVTRVAGGNLVTQRG